ncbi:MAG: DUF4367 domain-containing protein [Anaerosacchariphilus sp.]
MKISKSYDAVFRTEIDGEVIETIDAFIWISIDIMEVDRGDGEKFYTAQFEHGNAYYYLNGNIELEIFEKILNGIIIESV